jgi:hypothetical protein
MAPRESVRKAAFQMLKRLRRSEINLSGENLDRLVIVKGLTPAANTESAQYIGLDLKRYIELLEDVREAQNALGAYLNNIVRSKYRTCC